ncbi:competence protein CoiA family protein [Bacillus toyonensis]|uniref:competence protein CoiA family protein n=1 Tax=Bacillus toyonensis TaxID=155322 RepID=UPI002E1F810F|nr:competence protein CoiA family protein [Bacillus toyonensis]
MSVLITYALSDDLETPIHIDDATKDKNLKYYCEECNEELVIKHGTINRKHFSHRSDTTCKISKTGNGESIIHKYWKIYYSQLKEIDLPYYALETYEFGTELITKTKKVVIRSSQIEKTYTLKNGKQIRPDIILIIENGKEKGQEVALEIFYKNKKSKEYQYAYQDLKIPAFEVCVKEKKQGEITILYSSKELKLKEKLFDCKMIEHRSEALDSLIRAEERKSNLAWSHYPEYEPLKDIYSQLDQLEKKNRFKIDVPRYVFNIIYKQKVLAYPTYLLFFTTYKTYLGLKELIELKYTDIFTIKPSKNLGGRIRREERT